MIYFCLEFWTFRSNREFTWISTTSDWCTSSHVSTRWWFVVNWSTTFGTFQQKMEHNLVWNRDACESSERWRNTCSNNCVHVYLRFVIIKAICSDTVDLNSDIVFWPNHSYFFARKSSSFLYFIYLRSHSTLSVVKTGISE